MGHPRRDVAARRFSWAPPLPPEWYADALCAQVDPEIFFPERGGSIREAKKVCGGCPVRETCLEAALANDERAGVWGGVSERDRRKILKAREAA